MDSTNLLAREEEFKKLNKQLEKKTVSLMKEIENVMQKQDVFAEFTSNLHNGFKNEKQFTAPVKKLSPVPSMTKVDNTPKQTVMDDNSSSILSYSKTEDNSFSKPENNVDMDFFNAFVCVCVQDKVLPQSFLRDKVSLESVCKFMSSKIKLMEERINKLDSNLDRKVHQCEGHLTQIAEYESERLKMLNNLNNLKSISSDSKAKSMALQKRLDEKDRQFKEQRSEADRLSSELKRISSNNVNLEAKCITQEQEIERLRQKIETMKMSERELKTSSRNLSASHTNAISRQEAKIKSLSSAIEKQRDLIDNLKRQNGILSSEICLKSIEKEYSDFLMDF